MENNQKMTLTGLVCLLIGIAIGYLYFHLTHQGADVHPLSLSEKLVSEPLDTLEAREMIIKFRGNANVTMETRRSWKVERYVFDAILGQKDKDSTTVDAIQFYPAIGKDGGLTLILIGRYGDRLALKQVKAGLGEVKGEVWDYIGPCPPK
ncbi:MAG: hypothetical protein KKG00_14340, partial [Bacteroidetes bacterium]|nr:hypothetical protein [Bacteroidota bacterium]